MLAIWIPCIPCEFYNQPANFCREVSWDLDRNCNKLVDQIVLPPWQYQFYHSIIMRCPAIIFRSFKITSNDVLQYSHKSGNYFVKFITIYFLSVIENKIFLISCLDCLLKCNWFLCIDLISCNPAEFVPNAFLICSFTLWSRYKIFKNSSHLIINPLLLF